MFAWLPVETIVREHQQEYYNVIAKCDAAGESTLFVEFMLQCLLEAMENYNYFKFLQILANCKNLNTKRV